MSFLNYTEMLFGDSGLGIIMPCTCQRKDSTWVVLSVLVGHDLATGDVSKPQITTQLSPLGSCYSCYSGLNRHHETTAELLLETLEKLGRDFLKIKMSKYSPYFSHFAFCSLDCFRQFIACLHLVWFAFHNVSPSLFILWRKHFASEEKISVESFLGFKDHLFWFLKDAQLLLYIFSLNCYIVLSFLDLIICYF